MRLRNPADRRTMLWTFGFTPFVAGVQYARPELIPYLWWLSCFLAVTCGVIAHNHNHCPTFHKKGHNEFFSIWLSIFYGYPTFAWIPTHNLNHHKLVNKAGDATITWRFTNRHVFWVAVTYFFVSSFYQSDPIKQFIKKAKEQNPKLYQRIMVQYGAYLLGLSSLLGLGIALHGVKGGIITWLCVTAGPGLFSLWTIMLFNYEQHVHTDPWSEHNHSRNFTGKLLNFLLFNNGLHAAHHEHPGTHWSKLRPLHEAIEPQIDPALNEKSLWWYWLRQYALSPLFPSLSTVQVGRAPFDPPAGQERDLSCDDVGIAEVGTNAQRA